MIELESKGDAVWKRQFENAEDAYHFLYGLVGKQYSYHHIHRREAKSEEITALLAQSFDIEDDLIVWRETGKPNRYCAGWHWSQYNDRPKIIMPDGTELYDLFARVCDF